MATVKAEAGAAHGCGGREKACEEGQGPGGTPSPLPGYKVPKSSHKMRPQAWIGPRLSTDRTAPHTPTAALEPCGGPGGGSHSQAGHWPCSAVLGHTLPGLGSVKAFWVKQKTPLTSVAHEGVPGYFLGEAEGEGVVGGAGVVRGTGGAVHS